MLSKKFSKFLAFAIIASLFVSIIPLHPAYSMSGFGSVIDLSGPSPDVGSQRIFANGNNVYAVWTNAGDIFFNVSTDNGTTFPNPAINLSSDGAASTPQI